MSKDSPPSTAAVVRSLLAQLGDQQTIVNAGQVRAHHRFQQSQVLWLRFLREGVPLPVPPPSHGARYPDLQNPRLSTREVLPDSGSCPWRPERQPIVADPRLDPPAVVCQREAFSGDQVAAYAAGRPWDCFGEPWELAKPHQRTPCFTRGRGRLLDIVDHFEVLGGPWKRGYLAASVALPPGSRRPGASGQDEPAGLMLEVGLQAMAFFLAALGYTIRRDGWIFEPSGEEAAVDGLPGRETSLSGHVAMEVFVEEVVAAPVPMLYADLLGAVDGRPLFHARRMALRLVPGWPLDEGSPLLEDYVEPGPVARVGDFPLDFPSMLAMAIGRPSRALGPGYSRFDGLDTAIRMPSPPFHFITRALRVEGELGSMKQGMAAELEYDIPEDAWFFAENGNRTMPFAVLLDATLQPCGWLANYMGCSLSSPDSLLFRNLEGTGTLFAEVQPGGGPLRTRVRNTSLSRTASAIILAFEVECIRDGMRVYAMSTTFRDFPASAFANQAGLPTSDAQRAFFEAPGAGARTLETSRSSRGRARMARPMLLMVVQVDLFEPEGGEAGLGRVRGQKDVDPGEWFFKAHFFQDPVQPGSLGIEAMLQLLQWTMLELGLDRGMAEPRFQPLALGEALTWKYRGQVVPGNRQVTITLEITQRGRDDGGAFALAKASLWCDGKRIYETANLGMRIVDGGGAGDGRCTALDPAQHWLRDHCPAFTLPALPMAVMVDLLAQAARPEECLIGLREVRVRGWLVCARALTLQCERKDERVSLWHGEREVASAVLVFGPYPEAPAPLPPLEGPPAELPYVDGSVFHGPAFQLMESLVRTASGASSRVRADSAIPLGRLNPGLLDAATHGIPGDHLDLWDSRLSPDKVAYPARILELVLYGRTPRQGLVRCEVRPAGLVGSPDYPVFEIQIIGNQGLWCRLRMVYACFPKGSLVNAPPLQRRAFLRDHQFVQGVALSQIGLETTTLKAEALAGLDWVPGGVAAIYGTGDPMEIARREHLAAAHQLHPSLVPAALPLTRWELDVRADDQGTISVSGSGRGTLDLSGVRDFWNRHCRMADTPVGDLYFALLQRFLGRVVLADPEAWKGVQGRSVLYLANHQVEVESILFPLLVSALNQVPTSGLVRVERRDSWLGQLVHHAALYPGVPDPELITTFDPARPATLGRLVKRLARAQDGSRRSLMVHVEGAPSLSCRHPVREMPGLFLETLLYADLPIVPVRFTGGLPVEAAGAGLGFPVGMGRQDYWLGRPIWPGDLAGLSDAERQRLVLNAINDLGNPNGQEIPHSGCPAFAAEAERWMVQTGVSHEHAVVRSALAEWSDPCGGTRTLLQATAKGAALQDLPAEGSWLKELARRLGGGA